MHPLKPAEVPMFSYTLEEKAIKNKQNENLFLDYQQIMKAHEEQRPDEIT